MSCPGYFSYLNYVEENKLFTFITGFTFTVIFIFIYILKAYMFLDKRRIPQVVHPTAPFGNIKDVIFRETTMYVHLWKYYNKFKRKGFKYGGLYLFFKPSLLIIDPTLMEKIISEKMCIKNVIPKPLQNCNVEFFNNTDLEFFLIKYNVIKDSLLTNLNHTCTSTVMHNFFKETASLAFGFKTNENFLSVVNSIINKKYEASFKYYFSLVHPLFQRNIGSSHEMRTIIEDTIRYRKKNDVKEKDVIQHFIDLFNEGDYDQNALTLYLFNILVDNITISYNSLVFCLYELASNEIIQQNLVHEIRKFSEASKTINVKGLDQLVYLDAVIKETFRKYPPIPTSINKCEKCCRIDEFGVVIPEGVFLIYSTLGVHRDPTNYSEPNKFDPNRFLDQLKDISKIYVPFGLNRTAKVGLQLTTWLLKLSLISILSSYSVSLNSKLFLELDNKKLLLFPKEPVPIIFNPVSNLIEDETEKKKH